MAQLTIEYDKDVLTNGYYIKTKVLSADPASIQSCLVVRKPSSADGETLVRVATLVDLEALPSAEGLLFFTAIDIGTHGAVEDSILRFTTLPPEWVKAGLSPDLDYTIDSIPDVNTVKIKLGVFPHYYRGDLIAWELRTAGDVLITNGSGGETIRDQPTEDMYYRTTEYIDVYPDLNAATNAQASFDSQAQSLVDDSTLGAESFSGTEEKVYTS